MPECLDCKLESPKANGWYADFEDLKLVMRCPSCGEKEYKKRWEMRYGDKPLPKKDLDDEPKEDRIALAKEKREAHVSPWQLKEQN